MKYVACKIRLLFGGLLLLVALRGVAPTFAQESSLDETAIARRLDEMEKELVRLEAHQDDQSIHMATHTGLEALRDTVAEIKRSLEGTLQLAAQTEGGEWLRLVTPEGKSFKFVYRKPPLDSQTQGAPGAPRVRDCLAIEGPRCQEFGPVLFTGGGSMLIGFNTLPVHPVTGEVYLFGVRGDILIGDIAFIGEGPITVGRRYQALSKATPTYLMSNRHFDRDLYGGASIALWSDEAGAADGGRIDLCAYGRGTGPAANSIRFSRRGNPDQTAESLLIDGEGNVGIGTRPPAGIKLAVQGNLKVGSRLFPAALMLYDKAAGKRFRLEVSDGELRLQPDGGNP